MSWETIKERIVWNPPSKGKEAELPTIAEIKYDPYPCEDCGIELCEKRVVLSSVRQTPFLHMKHLCKICNKVKNPETGKYDCSPYTYETFLRPSKRK